MKTFQQLFTGTLYGILAWDKWDALRARISGGSAPWYVYAVGHGLPEQPLSGAALGAALDELDALLRRDHDEDYLGIVYADDLEDTAMVKIFDPNHMGSSCSTTATPPGWVLSRVPPEPVASDIPVTQSRKRWWQGLMGRLAGN